MKRPGVSPLQLALAAGAVGIACGAAAQRQLPAAGSDRDDGTGLLAAASTQLFTRPSGYGGAAYAAASYGRAAAYGGGYYANYQFRPGSRHRRGYPATYVDGYRLDPSRPTGRIAGRLAWKKRPRVSASDRCPPPPASPALAIVSLRDVRAGRGFPETRLRDRSRYQLGGVVAIGPCGFEPVTQAVGPIGLLGTAVQRGDGRARVLGVVTATNEVLFELDFRSRGERREFELRWPGVIELSGPGGARGWIAVIGHPLYAAADPDGGFAIEQVPAGEHTLSVWHPPIGGSPAIEVERKIVVRAGATARVAITLDPERPARRTRASGSGAR